MTITFPGLIDRLGFFCTCMLSFQAAEANLAQVQGLIWNCPLILLFCIGETFYILQKCVLVLYFIGSFINPSSYVAHFIIDD